MSVIEVDFNRVDANGLVMAPADAAKGLVHGTEVVLRDSVEDMELKARFEGRSTSGLALFRIS